MAHTLEIKSIRYLSGWTRMMTCLVVEGASELLEYDESAVSDGLGMPMRSPIAEWHMHNIIMQNRSRMMAIITSAYAKSILAEL